MPQQIKSDTIFYRVTEADAFGSANDGTTSGTATPAIERNPDIGNRSDAAATDTTGSKTGIALWKGIFDKIPGVAAIETLLTAIRDRLPSSPNQQGAGTVTATTQRMVLASDGPTVSTLTSLLNATTQSQPVAPQIITFTIASGATISNYQQLKGWDWLIFFPPATGTSISVAVKLNDVDATGDDIRDQDGNIHTFLVSSSNRIYGSQATSFLSSAIGSQIAFKADTAQASAITITLKAVV